MDLRNRDFAFDAPIPGESMTAPIGGRPWQNPPALTTIEEVATHYLNAMATDEFTQQAINLLEDGMPVVTIADTMQTYGVMERLHSLDLGILAGPVIAEYIMYIGDKHEIEYVTGLDEEPEDNMNLLVSTAMKRMNKKDSMEEDLPEILDEDEESMGLMSRNRSE